MKAAKRILAVAVLVAVLVQVLLPVAVQAEDLSVQHGLGLVASEGDLPALDLSTVSLDGMTALPRVVDMSGDLPPVGNQGAQSSCVGWALAYYGKTQQEHRERGWDTTAAQHQFSAAWVYNQRPNRSNGGMSLYSGLTILRDQGAAQMSVFPYDSYNSSRQPTTGEVASAAAYKIRDFAMVFAGAGQANVETIKTLLANGNAVVMAVPVYPSFYRASYENPLVTRPAAGETFYGFHALLVVGYDDTVGGFQVVNSWGDGWGRDGLGYLSYDFVKRDVLEAWVMYDQIELRAQAPKQGNAVAAAARSGESLTNATVATMAALPDEAANKATVAAPATVRGTNR